MIQLTLREKILAGAVLLSLLVGAAAHRYRHPGIEPSKDSKPAASAKPAKILR